MRKVLPLIAILLSAGSVAAGVVTVDRIHRAVAGFVRAELEGSLAEGERIEIDTRWQHDVAVDGEGDVAVRVQQLSGNDLMGPTVMRVVLEVDGKTEREMSVTADIRHFRRVLVAHRSLRRGEELVAGAVEEEERDITRERYGFFTDPQQLEGMRVRRTVRPGDLLTQRHVEMIPVIQRGEDIQMTVDSRNLLISTAGVALEDGGIGERIRVRNPDSGKIVYGHVVDANRVVVGR